MKKMVKINEVEDCPHCHKNFSKGVEAAFRLGLQEGENRLKKTINEVLKNNTVVLSSNQRLAQELLRLDLLLPLKGTPSIIIPLKKAKSILGALRQKSDAYKYFQKVLGEQMCSVS